MNLNFAPSNVSFKGMIKLSDENYKKYAINPQHIASVTDLCDDRWSLASNDNKNTRIDLVSGGVYFTPTKFDEVLNAIDSSNNREGCLDISI